MSKFIKIGQGLTELLEKQEIRSMERVSAQCCTLYSITDIEIFEYNCNDLELGRFKVIQGQR